ncbi:MAG: acyl-CoA thioesterase [Flavobacteriales bacterium]|jgi:acyl-CoA hydrolase|nr:acyl-CoA thioesterase [Flavobacteriales bacterium]
MQKVFAKSSKTILTELVLPNDTNPLNNLMGGRLLHWMDIATAISARRFCKRVVVTAAVNHVSFDKPIPMGSVVTLEAQVSRAFKSSMEVIVDVFMEDNTTGDRIMCNQAIYTFVAVDQQGKPIEVPVCVPETEEEIKRFDAALRRRQLGLVLSKRMKAEDATELKAIFEESDS